MLVYMLPEVTIVTRANMNTAPVWEATVDILSFEPSFPDS